MSTGILSKPTLGPYKVDPRPYQSEAIAAVRNEYVNGIRRTMIILATGTGKTLVSSFIGRKVIEKGGRILFLAPSTELVEQAANKFDLVGIEVGIEQASQQARSIFEPDAVIGSIQTMKGKRLSSWSPDYFNMIIVDECDYGFMGTYRKILDYFGKARVLGISATVARADEEDLGQFYESIAYTMSAYDGMTAEHPGPYLCRLIYDLVPDLDIDLRDLRPKKGDLSPDELDARIAPLADTLANAIRKEAENRRTLIYTPGIRSAQGIATALSSLKVSAECVSGDDPEREAKVERFRKGETQMLASCSLFLRGFDVPEVAAIALCRPTKSQSLLDQIIGRGLRLANGKDNCRLIDFNYLTDGYDLARPIALLETPIMDGGVLDAAQELMKQDKQLDMLEAIEQGEQIHKERQILRIKAKEREMRYKRVLYDPLSVCDAIGMPWRGKRIVDVQSNFATEGQVKFLEKLGITGAEKMSKTRATTLIKFCVDRRKQGLARPRQVSCIIGKGGVDPEIARSMTFNEASDFLDSLFSKRV